MKNMIKPVLVLTVICLVTSVLLAAVNSVTKPTIEAYEAEQAAKACLDVMPDGKDFESVALPDVLPATVTAIWRDASGGYVFKMTTNGFSSGYQIMCGISADGKITGTKVLAHSETPGYGSRTAEPEYENSYIGEDKSMHANGESYLLSGATKSSTAYRAAISDALSAFTIITREG